ncbi:hypothetical protein [Paraclostridium bifermentans]|uniref:hypothetical protein n=1 Tax=Paraclostridium bifermentans TaxID=1490 RepID=UPI00359C2EF0
MKKIKFIIPLIIILPILYLIATINPNPEPKYDSTKSKYDNLESAFLEYVEILYSDETLTTHDIVKDLTGRDSYKTDSSSVQSLDFEYEDKVLDISFVENSLHDLRLETNINNLNKSIQLYETYSASAHVTSSSINTHKKLLNSIDSSFDIEFIELNKETIDSYLLLLEILESDGYLTLDSCRNVLGLKLDTIDDTVDMTGSYKFGYWKIYKEKGYTITAYEDVVIDMYLQLNAISSGIDHSILLGTTNEFIFSDENQVNTFITKTDINELLDSSYSATAHIFLAPDYNEVHEVPKEKFYKLYDLVTSLR